MKYVGLYDNAKDIVTKEKLDAKQDKITISGILKGNGAGGVSKAVADRDYATCTNLRNGSADDSLRTTASSEESPTYTMKRGAFAEGVSTKSSGIASHAEGEATSASGNNSHSEGYATIASGASSHSEGHGTISSGYYSHAEGKGTTANHRSQHVQGEDNIADDSTADTWERGNYVHIVGNGTSDSARSNAHTLDWSGNAWFAGDVYVGSTSGTNKDEGSKKLIKEGDAGLLPTVTTADNGKFLRVVNGAWAAATVNNANGVSF